MKNQLRFIIVSIACLVGACLAEQNNPLVVASCSDGIKNQNEEGVDCGGVCLACIKPLSVPCKDSLVDNRITIDGANTTLTASNFGCAQNTDGNYQLTILTANYEIDIVIFGSLPTKNTIYSLINPYNNLSDGYASVLMSNLNYYDPNLSSTGKLYLTYLNNKWTIQLCTIDLSGYYGSHKFRGSIVCG